LKKKASRERRGRSDHLLWARVEFQRGRGKKRPILISGRER